MDFDPLAHFKTAAISRSTAGNTGHRAPSPARTTASSKSNSAQAAPPAAAVQRSSSASRSSSTLRERARSSSVEPVRPLNAELRRSAPALRKPSPARQERLDIASSIPARHSSSHANAAPQKERPSVKMEAGTHKAGLQSAAAAGSCFRCPSPAGARGALERTSSSWQPAHPMVNHDILIEVEAAARVPGHRSRLPTAFSNSAEGPPGELVAARGSNSKLRNPIVRAAAPALSAATARATEAATATASRIRFSLEVGGPAVAVPTTAANVSGRTSIPDVQPAGALHATAEIAAPGPASVQPLDANGTAMPEWHLKELSIDGDVHLLDSSTNLLYTLVNAGKWPEPVGKMVQGMLQPFLKSYAGTLFGEVSNLVQSSPDLFADMFRRADVDGKGMLSVLELARLCSTLLPEGLLSVDHEYFHVMLQGFHSCGAPSMGDFLSAVERCTLSELAVMSLMEPDVLDTLECACQYLVNSQACARQLFSELDTAGTGRLSLEQLAKFWCSALPALQQQPLQFILVHLYKHDTDGRGRFTYEGVCRALRAVRLVTTSTVHAPGFVLPDGSTRGNAISHSPLNLEGMSESLEQAKEAGAEQSSSSCPDGLPDSLPPPPPQQLKYHKPTLAERLAEAYGSNTPATPSKLYHHFVHKGRRLVMDRATGLVFSAIMRGALPKLMGKVQQDSSVRPKRNLLTRAPFMALQHVAQASTAQLEEVFKEHDANQDGKLTVAELVLLLEYLVPSASKTDLLYYQAMLIAKDTPCISRKELLDGITDCYSTEQQLCTLDGQVALKRLLLDCQEIIAVTPGGIKLICKENDSRKAGRLMPLDWAALLRMTVPLETAQLRMLLSHVYTFDVDCSGNLSAKEIALALSPEPFFMVADVGSDSPLSTPKVGLEQAATGMQLQGTAGMAAAVAAAAAATATATAVAAGEEEVDMGSPQSARWSVGQMLVGPPNACHDWYLTRTQVKGVDYLLEPMSQLLYVDVPAQQWPPLVGRKLGATITDTMSSISQRTAFSILDSGLMRNEASLEQRFMQATARAPLPVEDMDLMLHDMAPELQQGQLDYAKAMLQLISPSFCSFEQLSAAIGQCMTQEQAAFHPRSQEARQLLHRVSKHMEAEMATYKRLFDSLDTTSTTRLPWHQVLQLMQQADSSLKTTELQVILSHIYSNQLPSSFRGPTFLSIAYSLRAISIHSPSGMHTGGFAPTRKPAAGSSKSGEALAGSEAAGGAGTAAPVAAARSGVRRRTSSDDGISNIKPRASSRTAAASRTSVREMIRQRSKMLAGVAASNGDGVFEVQVLEAKPPRTSQEGGAAPAPAELAPLAAQAAEAVAAQGSIAATLASSCLASAAAAQPAEEASEKQNADHVEMFDNSMPCKSLASRMPARLAVRLGSRKVVNAAGSSEAEATNAHAKPEVPMQQSCAAEEQPAALTEPQHAGAATEANSAAAVHLNTGSASDQAAAGVPNVVAAEAAEAAQASASCPAGLAVHSLVAETEGSPAEPASISSSYSSMAGASLQPPPALTAVAVMLPWAEITKAEAGAQPSTPATASEFPPELIIKEATAAAPAAKMPARLAARLAARRPSSKAAVRAPPESSSQHAALTTAEATAAVPTVSSVAVAAEAQAADISAPAAAALAEWNQRARAAAPVAAEAAVAAAEAAAEVPAAKAPAAEPTAVPRLPAQLAARLAAHRPSGNVLGTAAAGCNTLAPSQPLAAGIALTQPEEASIAAPQAAEVPAAEAPRTYATQEPCTAAQQPEPPAAPLQAAPAGDPAATPCAQQPVSSPGMLALAEARSATASPDEVLGPAVQVTAAAPQELPATSPVCKPAADEQKQQQQHPETAVAEAASALLPASEPLQVSEQQAEQPSQQHTIRPNVMEVSSASSSSSSTPVARITSDVPTDKPTFPKATPVNASAVAVLLQQLVQAFHPAAQHLSAQADGPPPVADMHLTTLCGSIHVSTTGAVTMALQALEFSPQQQLLLEPVTGLVYQQGGTAAGMSGWPALLGRMGCEGTLYLRRLDDQLQLQLHGLMQQVQAQGTWAQLAQQRDVDTGRMAAADATAICRQLMPSLGPGQLGLVQALFSARAEAYLSHEEALAALRQGCAGYQAAQAGEAALLRVLHRLSQQLVAKPEPFLAELGKAACARLDYAQLCRSLKKLFGHHLVGRDLRYILAFIYHADVDKTGSLKVLELMQLLRLVALLAPDSTHASGFAIADFSLLPRWAAVSRADSPPASPAAKPWSEARLAAVMDKASSPIPCIVLEDYGREQEWQAQGRAAQQRQQECNAQQQRVQQQLPPPGAGRQAAGHFSPKIIPGALQALYRQIQSDPAGFQPVLSSMVQQSRVLQGHTCSGQQLFEEQLALVVQQCLASSPPEDIAYCVLLVTVLQNKSVDELTPNNVLTMIKRGAAIEQAAQSCQPSRTASSLLRLLVQELATNRLQLGKLACQGVDCNGLLDLREMMAILHEHYAMTADQYVWIASALQLHGCKCLGGASDGQLTYEQMESVLQSLAVKYSSPGMQHSRPSSMPGTHCTSSSGQPAGDGEVPSNIKQAIETFESLASSRREIRAASQSGSRRGSAAGQQQQQ